MSKFIDLVVYRQRLLDVLDRLDIDNTIDKKESTLTSLGDPYIPELTKLTNQYSDIRAINRRIIDGVNDLIKKVEEDLDAEASALFALSTMGDDDYFHNVHRIEMSNELMSTIKIRVGDYCDWRFPALSLYPDSRDWIDPLVANDPLYILHFDNTVLNESIKHYPELYQNRLRLYNSLNDLPQNQFGLILAWNVFDYYHLSKIKKYLAELFQLLKPGGVLVFSYNNCDFEGSALRAESKLSSYSTFRNIKLYLEELGYEIISAFDVETDSTYNPHVSWVEVRKPGILTTVKAHQAIAEIIEQ